MENASEAASIIVRSKAEDIALCSAFILECVLIVVGNLFVIILFAANKGLRKKSLLLVINMSFADLMLGALTLPIYIYINGAFFWELWSGSDSLSLDIFYEIVDTTFLQASLISATFVSVERFYAIYWPFKHKTLSMRAYRIVITVVWTLALLFASVYTALRNLISSKHAMYVLNSYMLILLFITFGCNISIWRKFQRGSVASQQQNRAAQNKRLTKTLLFVSVLALMSWVPLIIMNFLIFVFHLPIPLRFYDLVNVVNYSNSFVNPVVYALRIREFKQALALCCFEREAARNDEGDERKRKQHGGCCDAGDTAKNITNRSHQSHTTGV